MKTEFSRWECAYTIFVVAVGLLLRAHLALSTYLNPDEAVQALVAFEPWGDMLSGSLQFTHPPLLIAITHAIASISRTELAVRLVPLLAGSLFPLLIFLWLRRIAGKMAALAALFLLTLAPHLIEVSAQLRSYTLAFLFLSAALVLLEEALENDRVWIMAFYNVVLWLCILSDYSTAWFVGAAGAYALLRLRQSSFRLKAMWAGGQAAALALYGLIFAVHVQSLRGAGIEKDAISRWLRGAFPIPGEVLIFPFAGTLKQFAYLTASLPLGFLASALFGAALFLLWTGRTGIERGRARALVVLLALPFLLGIAGAYAHHFPYGRSRHTLVVGLFAACGVAVLLQSAPRRAASGLLWTALLLTPLWHWRADRDLHAIGPDRNRKDLLLQCLDYMRAAIPPGAVIFTEDETLWILAYYDGHTQLPRKAATRVYSETPIGPWRVAVRHYNYVTKEKFKAGLAAFRRQYGLKEQEPVWVLDGGWDVVSGPPDETRPFTRAVRVFQAGAP